jgi:hypothetical protein
LSVERSGTQRVSTIRRISRSLLRAALAATVVLGVGEAMQSSPSPIDLVTDGATATLSGTISAGTGTHAGLMLRQSTSGSTAAQGGGPAGTSSQDLATGISFRGSWSVASHRRYRGGQAYTASQRGARATLTFSGTGITWIGPTGPTRGQARIYIDGRYVRTVDTYAATFHPSRVLYSARWTTTRDHVIRIVVLGTRGRPTVAIDELVVRGAAPGDGSQIALAPTPTLPPTPPPGATPTPTPTPPVGASPTPTSPVSPTPAPIGARSVRVSSVTGLLAALADDAVDEIVVANGTYHVSPAGSQKADSLWIGAAFAGRSRAIAVRAETPGGVTFDGGGTTSLGGITFVAGAHDQTWDGFVFANGTPSQTGVVVFGGYAGLAAPHHITLRNITIGRSVTSTSTDASDHAVYFSHAVGGPHDILIDGLTVDGAGGLYSALHFFHSDSTNRNAWNVTVRHMQVSGTVEAVMLWDTTLRDIVIEDSTITGARKSAVRYEGGSAISIRRVTSTGSGQLGFYSTLGPSPSGISITDSSLN